MARLRIFQLPSTSVCMNSNVGRNLCWECWGHFIIIFQMYSLVIENDPSTFYKYHLSIISWCGHVIKILSGCQSIHHSLIVWLLKSCFGFNRCGADVCPFLLYCHVVPFPSQTLSMFKKTHSSMLLNGLLLTQNGVILFNKYHY